MAAFLDEGGFADYSGGSKECIQIIHFPIRNRENGVFFIGFMGIVDSVLAYQVVAGVDPEGFINWLKDMISLLSMKT